MKKDGKDFLNYVCVVDTQKFYGKISRERLECIRESYNVFYSSLSRLFGKNFDMRFNDVLFDEGNSGLSIMVDTIEQRDSIARMLKIGKAKSLVLEKID